MKRAIFIMLALCAALALFSCGEKAAHVDWAGEYGSEKGVLHIVDYDGRSFRFTLRSDTDMTIEGTAAIDPDNPLFAQYMQLSFRFNPGDDAVACTGGDYGAYEATYVRADEILFSHSIFLSGVV